MKSTFDSKWEGHPESLQQVFHEEMHQKLYTAQRLDAAQAHQRPRNPSSERILKGTNTKQSKRNRLAQSF